MGVTQVVLLVPTVFLEVLETETESRTKPSGMAWTAM